VENHFICSIVQILESGRLAPQTDTTHHYLGVVKKAEIKNEIGEATLGANWVANAPVIFICCSDISWDLGKQNKDDYGVIGNKLRYGNEIVDFLMQNKDRKKTKTLTLATPAYIAGQQMILTAISYNLRGCIVDFIDIEKINKILKLPEYITCQLLLPIGYPDEIPKERIMKSKDEMYFYETWK